MTRRSLGAGTPRRRALLTLVAVVAVSVAPLAAGGGGASAAVIDGARSLQDSVVVRFPRPATGPTTDVHVLGFNDFHGNLEPATLNIYGQFAGGAAWLSRAIKDRQALYGERVATVMAGDNIGASPLVNGLFFEEPATIVTNLMGVDYGSVGNHEFDKGAAELLRIQDGGCRPEGCTGAPYALAGGGSSDVYPGADFQYLAANVIVEATGEPLLPAYGTKAVPNSSGGTTTVGFIGAVLEETPTIVTPSGVAGLDFIDEADAANAAVDDLRAAGAETIVLVIHQGGFQQGGSALNGCNGNLAGTPILDIASRLDPAIDVIVSGHTHSEYRCTLTTGGTTRLITSASSFGRILTDITLTIDDATGQLTVASAENVIVRNSTNTPGAGITPDLALPKDPEVAAVVAQYVAAAAPLANEVIGSITADITRAADAQGESALGDVIADVQLAATAPADKGGAVIAFMNPGGIRADLVYAASAGGEAPGQITYGEAFTVQPFGNSLVVKTLTGAQIRSLLEQQFVGCGGQTTQRILQISAGFSYEQDASAATCAAKVGAITLDGNPIDPGASYRVTMNSFLATGGDGFTVFNAGTDPLGGELDTDALRAYFATASPVAPGPQDRILAGGPGPVIPESPLPWLLPVGAAVVMGAGYVVLRRRPASAA